MKARIIITTLLESKPAIFGVCIVAVFLIMAAFANYISPYDPLEMDIVDRLQSPNKLHLLGTDQYGRDIFSRIVYGARISLKVSVSSVSVALILGLIIGSLTGYYGGFIDGVLMRVMDILFSFPAVLLALVIICFLGPSLNSLIIALIIRYTPIFSRIVRSSVLVEKENVYVLASKALGQTNLRTILFSILPNCISPIIVQASINLSWAILAENTLSFLGLGVPPPAPSWGRMLNEARQFIESAPHVAIFPGMAISLVVLGFNVLGDGIRDILDPRTYLTRVRER
jgi:peptide/nickel transport system permease protein